MPAKKGPKQEPVTDRLFKTLPHPDRQSNISVARFSPDGSRFLMTGYPSGIVQMWDAKSWKEASRIDTPSGMRSSWEYALPSDDWKSILVYVMSRKPIRQEKDGKVKDRLQVDGRVDIYDSASGKRSRSIALSDRGPSQMLGVPGGKLAVVNTMWSFDAGPDRPVATELLDLESGKAKKLFDSQSQPAFAADGKTAFISITSYSRAGELSSSLVKYDLTEAKVLKTKEVKDKHTYHGRPTLSPDGKRLFVLTGRYVMMKSEDTALAILDSETFTEVGRIPTPKTAEPHDLFDEPLVTADGKTMITRCGGPLIVWDMTANKVIRTVPVADISMGRLLLSPDGKRAGVAGVPKFERRRDMTVQDMPQPRLVLIDLTDSTSKPQTLMLPATGMIGGASFSPDGGTLAVGGAGGVHLLDVGRVGTR